MLENSYVCTGQRGSSEGQFRRLSVLVCAYSIDKNDISEAQVAYQWITRLARVADLWVVTSGSRLHDVCGLEEHHGIKLTILRPRFNYKRWDNFDRAVQPGFIEFYFRACRVARDIARNNRLDLCHHMAPQSVRYPTPLDIVGLPLVVGPIHGGLGTPAVMREFVLKEALLFELRRLDVLRMRWDPWLRRTYAKAKKLLISAPYVKQALPPQYRPKCSVVPGIAVDDYWSGRCRRGSGGDYVRLIYVGRITPSKGLELLLYALGMCRTRSRIRLDVFGEGPQESGYRDMAMQLGIEGIVNWRGFVVREKVLDALAGSDIFVLPSLKEPAGIAVIEAMSLGLPVICVDAGGPSYIIDDDCGVKVRLSTKDEMIYKLAQAVDTLVEDADRRIAMGRKAQERIKQHFTWNAVVKKILDVYNEVVFEQHK